MSIMIRYLVTSQFPCIIDRVPTASHLKACQLKSKILTNLASSSVSIPRTSLDQTEALKKSLIGM
ncbi:hypothetical protein QUB68_13140 [Microcoleus sp. A006_D1]|uniref:hypothetical protein n=1 Tax=Microcoleus sp. A006_D1 TaxID=3055267 RepID=UPI002FCFEE03